MNAVLVFKALVLLMAMSSVSFGQAIADYRFRAGYNGRIGYIDASGRLVIDAVFEDAWPFSEGLAAVRRSGKWSYINLSGDLVIELPAGTVQAAPFREGLAAFQDSGDKWGYVDRSGHVAIQPIFDRTQGFSEGLALVEQNRRWFFIDRAGNQAVAGDFQPVTGFSEGLAAVKINDRVGFIDSAGAVIIGAKFLKAEHFSEGLAAASEDGRTWGYIGKNGEWAIAPSFEAARPFSEGLAVVQREYRRGAVRKDGSIAVDFRFQYLRSFSLGLAPAALGRVFGYIDSRGRFVIQPAFSSANGFAAPGVALVAIQEKAKPGQVLPPEVHGYIDISGKLIWPTNAAVR
jgi:hypothetical protein